MAKPQLLEDVGKVSELNTDNKTVVGGINEILEKEKQNTEQINVLNEKFDNTVLTAMNGWTNKTYTISKLNKDGNTVTLMANIQGGTCTAFTQIFQIPNGYRPTGLIYLDVTEQIKSTRTTKGVRLQANGVMDLDSDFTSGCTININAKWSVV